MLENLKKIQDLEKCQKIQKCYKIEKNGRISTVENLENQEFLPQNFQKNFTKSRKMLENLEK